MRTNSTLFACTGILVFTLTGCGSGTDSEASAPTGTSPSATTATSTSPSATTPLTVTDAWATAADAGTTAVFGELTNTTDAEVHIVSVSTSASDRGELHEMATVDGQTVMQVKPDGIRIPANETRSLAPGGDHVMVMDLQSPVKAGDVVNVTLMLEGGATVEFDATAKPFAGANESYHSTASHTMRMSATG